MFRFCLLPRLPPSFPPLFLFGGWARITVPNNAKNPKFQIVVWELQTMIWNFCEPEFQKCVWKSLRRLLTFIPSGGCTGRF